MQNLTEQQMCEVEMIHNKASAKISYSPDATYEDIIKIALERFGIPFDYSRFIQIAFHRYTFDKNTFEYYLRLFPSPEIAFEIDVDYVALLDGLHDSMQCSEEEQKQPKTSQKRNNSKGNSRRRHTYFKKPWVPKAAAT